MTPFKTYDIRGLYPDEVNEDLASKVGAQFSKISETVVVGHDIRKGSESIANAFISSAVRHGCHVIDIGLVPNPVCFYYAFQKKCHGVYVTASHNPAGYNGIKILDSKGRTDSESLRFLEKNLESKPLSKAGFWEKDFYSEFEYLKKLGKVKIKGKIKVGVDCMNGASSLIIKNVLASHNFGGVILNSIPKQDFGNRKPEPTPENAKELCETIVKQGLDFGIMFDSDCDRSLILSDKGEVIQGDLMGMILAKELYSGEEIVTPVDSTMLVKDLKGKVDWTPIGRPFIEKELSEKKLNFGFEASNHYYFNDFYPFSDGFLTMLKVAQFIKGKKLSSYFDKLPKTFIVRENFEFKSGSERDEVFEKAKKHFTKKYPKSTTMDGVKVVLKDSWFLFRVSNTEPIIRFTSESLKRESAQDLLFEFKKIV